MARYALTIFTSAFLLFGVQPLVGRFALPWFGGTPGGVDGVHALLPGGAAGRLRLRARESPRGCRPAQAQLHLGLLARHGGGARRARAAGRARRWRPGRSGAPGRGGPPGGCWRCWRSPSACPSSCCPPPAPLLQSWFAPRAAGRLALPALCAVQRGLAAGAAGLPLPGGALRARAARRRWGWAAGFVLFVVRVRRVRAGRVRSARRCRAPATAEPRQASLAAVEPERAARAVGRTLVWLGLSTCASVLLLATTNQLSQDVAAGPFLWVLPLALYLLTFILAFEREAFYRARRLGGCSSPRWRGVATRQHRGAPRSLGRCSSSSTAARSSPAAWCATASCTGCGRRRAT